MALPQLGQSGASEKYGCSWDLVFDEALSCISSCQEKDDHQVGRSGTYMSMSYKGCEFRERLTCGNSESGASVQKKLERRKKDETRRAKSRRRFLYTPSSFLDGSRRWPGSPLYQSDRACNKRQKLKEAD